MRDLHICKTTTKSYAVWLQPVRCTTVHLQTYAESTIAKVRGRTLGRTLCGFTKVHSNLKYIYYIKRDALRILPADCACSTGFSLCLFRQTSRLIPLKCRLQQFLALMRVSYTAKLECRFTMHLDTGRGGAAADRCS